MFNIRGWQVCITFFIVINAAIFLLADGFGVEIGPTFQHELLFPMFCTALGMAVGVCCKEINDR